MELSLEPLIEATQGLIRSVDGLSEDDLAAPSALPGWSRAHVVAHLALNAEGLSGVLEGLLEHEDVPMYASPESRDADIEALAVAVPPEMRERFLGSTTRFVDAVVDVAKGGWVGTFWRTPGGEQLPRVNIPAMRLREVEVHHADLLCGYGAASWPPSFASGLFEEVVADRASGPGAVLRTPTGDVTLAGGGPEVTGSVPDLTWWLLGRGSGEGLTGDLPTLGPWR
ncbi:MAG: maleylpyruvate isomerase family mycothiol-dependent enzyme [Nocardioides sp.]|jgi:maleylpyruvate isomerase